jgi:dipeptide/tripeptide permease
VTRSETFQVGDLYSAEDLRRETAFQIYYGALNLGAFVAPLITGVLAQTYGWHYGFAFAGFGMLVGLVVYLSGGRDLPPDAVRSANAVRRKLSSKERRVALVMVLMLPIFTLFWIAQILKFWWWQARRSSEPDDLTKLAIGCLLFGAAIAWLAAGQLAADETGKEPLAWAPAYHFLSAIGYLYFAPVAVALFSRRAPASINAMMIGVYYLSIFAGSTISGRLGGLYERLSAAHFWVILIRAIRRCGGPACRPAPRLASTCTPFFLTASTVVTPEVLQCRLGFYELGGLRRGALLKGGIRQPTNHPTAQKQDSIAITDGAWVGLPSPFSLCTVSARS